MSNTLYHYNPYHDRLGRFASSRGGSAGRNRTAANIARATTRYDRAKSDPRNMSTKDLQEANKRAAAIRKYQQNNRDTRLDTAMTVTNEANTTINRLRNSNREAMAQQQKARPRMDLSKMSDQELRDRINRENLERQYNQLFNDKPAVSKGRQNVDTILRYAGDVVLIAGGALTVAMKIKEMRGGSK